MRGLLYWLVLIVAPSLMGSAAKADPTNSEAWYSALPAEERFLIQSDLVLLGHYTKLVDGDFGPGTYESLTAFQATQGLRRTGVLSPDTLQKLHSAGESVISRLGLEYVKDERSGTAVPVPLNLLTSESTVNGGRRFTNSDSSFELQTIAKPKTETSFDVLYERLARDSATRRVAYRTKSAESFVVTGVDSGRSFYLLFQNAGDHSRGFSLSWLPAAEAEAKVVAVFLASYFMPLEAYLAIESPQEQTADAPPTASPDESFERMGSMAVLDGADDVVMLDGDITSSTPLEFLRALRARPNAHTVMLNSDGGLVDAGLIIAHEVRERGLSTLVPSGSRCFSACSFIYFAGVSREVQGDLGVHQVWNEANDLVGGQAKLSDVLEALSDFGVRQEVISAMLRTPPDEMHIFSDREVASLGLNSRVSPAAPPGNSEAKVQAQPEPWSDEDVFKDALQGALDDYQSALDLGSAGNWAEATERGEVAKANVEELCLSAGYPDIKACLGAELPPLPSSTDVSVGTGAATGASLLLEASEDGTTGAVPTGGTVYWSKATDEQGLPTVVGKANIPSKDLAIEILISKNSEPTLPASHLIEIKFVVLDGFAGGSIAGLPGVLLKSEELVQGTPLVGASARVVANQFVFALSARPDEFATNGGLLTSRDWMDLALVYATGRRAIITLERRGDAKGLFEQVWREWSMSTTVTSGPEDALGPALEASIFNIEPTDIGIGN